MVRLLISVEGLSEFRFLKQIIVPHLANIGISTQLHNMKGNISVVRVSNKLNKLVHNYDNVSTLYDFYGFKKLVAGETKQSLENKIKNKIRPKQQNKIIPYIQMYEFEALLFSHSEKMASGLNTSTDWIDEVLDNFSQNPETINNTRNTAPSKRIERKASYIKTTHAPNILSSIGLTRIRKKCHGFNEWLTKLEALGSQ